MSDVKISIIVPVYNTEKYLVKCLNSLLRQTLKGIQIICVNDGSTDKSLETLQRYASKWKCIEVIDQLNQGAGIARNTAFPHIKGKYTCFVDSDDTVSEDYCETLYNKAEETNAEVVYIENVLPDGYRMYFAAWKKLFLTKFLQDNNIQFSEHSPHEDLLFTWKSFILAKSITNITSEDPQRYYQYTHRVGSYCRTRSSQHFSVIPVLQEIEQLFKDYGKYEELKDIWCYHKLQHIAITFAQWIPKENKGEYFKLAATLFDR